MGKLTAIKTKSIFQSLLNSSSISEHNIHFILDTGLIYTHGIYINGAAYGTEASDAINLSIAGVTKSLALSSHTHSTYLEKNSDIDIGSFVIKSGDNELLKWASNKLILGSPTYITGTAHTTRNSTNYDILDTGNFSVVAKTSTNISLQNVATIKYGSSTFLIDYAKRINGAYTFDNITYTSIGTTNVNNQQYGIITMYTDGSTPASYALIRADIPNGKLEYRTSGSTAWKTLSTSAASVFGGSGAGHSIGLVPDPGETAGTGKFLCEDGTWRAPTYTSDTNTWRDILVNGTQRLSNSINSGGFDFINGSNTTVEWTNDNKLKINSTWNANALGVAGYVAAPTKAANANMTWLTDAEGVPAWRASNNHSHSYLPLSGGTLTGSLEISTGTDNNNYNEGLRITRANNNWAGITFGSTGRSGAPTNGWFAALNPLGQFIITPDNSGNTTGLTLNKNGDLKWRDNTVYHAGNLTPGNYFLKAGDTIGSGGFIKWESDLKIDVYLGRLTVVSHNGAVALGLNLGSLLISNAWADYPKVPTNGIWCKGQFISGVANGTAPLQITSSTLVSNLNADLLDGRHATGFVYWEGNPSKNNMNDIARSFYSSTGMTNLASSPVDNGDMSGWTHFFSTSYTDGGYSANAWVFLLACPAGSSNLQFRSRCGATITNNSPWHTGWTKIWNAGNFNPSNYLPLSGGTLTGALGKSNNYLIKPVADYRSTSSSITGCITITIPASVSASMISMWIDVYNYATNTSFSVYCAGYTWSVWLNQSALVFGANHRVRFGFNGTNHIIYIGETNSTWSYPQVAVRDVIVGFYPNYAKWYNDWTISFETSVSNVNADFTRYVITSSNINNCFKTINGQSIVGSGDITISGSGGGGAYLPLSGGTMTGNLTISHGTSEDVTASSSNPKITFSESGELPVHLIYTDYDSYRYPAGLKVVGGASASPAWFEAEGSIYAANFYTTSDRNKKQNISILSEHIRKFQLKDTKKWHYGVIALEVPEVFRDGEEGNMTVNYNSVLSYYVGLLENKVKELEEKIKELETNNKLRKR